MGRSATYVSWKRELGQPRRHPLRSCALLAFLRLLSFVEVGDERSDGLGVVRSARLEKLVVNNDSLEKKSRVCKSIDVVEHYNGSGLKLI